VGGRIAESGGISHARPESRKRDDREQKSHLVLIRDRLKGLGKNFKRETGQTEKPVAVAQYESPTAQKRSEEEHRGKKKTKRRRRKNQNERKEERRMSPPGGVRQDPRRGDPPGSSRASKEIWGARKKKKREKAVEEKETRSRQRK